MAESSFKVVPVTEAEPKKPASSGFKVTPLEQAQGSSGTYTVKSLNPSARFDDLAYVPGDTDQAYDQWREWWVNQEDRDFGLEDAMAIGSTMIGELYDGGKALLANAAEGEVTRIINSIGEGVMRGTADLGIMTLKGKEKLTRDDELTRERFRGWREIRKLEAMREKARRGDEDLIDHLAFSEDPDAFFGYNQTGDVDVDPALAEGASYVTDIGTVAGGAARGLVRKGIGQRAVQLQSKALRGAGKLTGQGMQKVGTIKDNLKAGFAERFPNAFERIGQAKDIATAAGLATNPKAALATRVAVEAADRIGPAGSALTKSIEDLPELPTNMGGFERMSKNMNLPEPVRATAAGISSAGGDKALRLGKDIGLGAAAGGAIGTAMSAASADTDAEFYGGIMGGAFTGGLGGAAGRVVDVVTGKDDAVRMQGSINAFVKEHTGSQDALANMASKSRSALENVVTASEVLRGRVNVKVVGADEFSKLVGDKGAEGFYDKERKEIIINGEGGDPGSTILHEVGEAMWDSGVVDKGLVRSEVVRHYGNLEDLKKAYAKTMLDAELPGKPTDDQIDQRVRELNRKFNDPTDDWVISEMFSEKFMAESSGPGLHNYIRNNSKLGKLKRIAQAAGSPLGNDLKIGRDSLSKAWNEVKGAALDVASQLKGGKGIDGLGFAKDNIFNEDLSKGKKLSKAYKKYSRDLNSQYKAAERGDEPARTVYLDNPDPTIDWDGVGKEYFDDVPSKGADDQGPQGKQDKSNDKDKSKDKGKSTSQNQKKAKSKKDIQQKVRNRRKAVKESLEKAEPSPNVDNVTLKPKYNDKGQIKPGPKEYRGKFLQDTFSGRPEMENFRGAIDTVNQAIADGRVLKSFYLGLGTRQGGDSWINSVTKNKGNIPVSEVDYIPYEWFVSGPGNVGVRVIDLNYMRARVNRWRDTDKLDLWNNDVDAFLDDAKMYLENHRNGVPGNTNLTEEKHAIVNTLFQGNNKGINPFYTAWDRGSGKRLYKTLRIERIGSLKDTDAKGTPFGMGPFDHLKVKKMMSPARGSKARDGINFNPEPLRPIEQHPENQPIQGRLSEKQANRIKELKDHYDAKTPERIETLQQDAINSLSSRLMNLGIPVPEAKALAKDTFKSIQKKVKGAMQVVSGMGKSDLSRLAGAGRPSVKTRSSVNPNWLTSAFESFENDVDLAMMKAQQVGGAESGVRQVTPEQGESFVRGERLADTKAFGSSLRDDEASPPRVYASVIEGQKFGSQGNYNLFFEWKEDTPMVVTSHHHYGVANGITDIHASANVGDKNARSFGDPNNETYTVLPSGRKVLDTHLLVGNKGAATARSHQLTVATPSSGLAQVGKAYKKDGLSGARKELAKVVSGELVGKQSQGKAKSYASPEGIPMTVAIQRNRTEAYVLNPDLANVKKVTIVSNDPNEVRILKNNLKAAFKNNSSKMPVIRVVNRASGESGNRGRKAITDEHYELTGQIRFSPQRKLNNRGGAVFTNKRGDRAVQTSSRAGIRVYESGGKRIGPVFTSIEKAERHLAMMGQ